MPRFLQALLAVVLALVGLAVLAVAFTFAAPAGTVVTNCTEAGLSTALAGGGAITFNCGGPTTINISTVKLVSVDASLDGGDQVTLSGGFGARLFYVNPGINFKLAHIVLEDAASTGGDGGAITNFGNLTLDHTTIEHSQTDSSHSGGAIFTQGPLTITHSALNNNAGGSAGALFANLDQAIVNISDSTFSGNQTVNAATGFGGAIWVGEGAQVAVTGGSITSNTAEFGGGVYITQGGFFTVTANGAPALISGNTANYAGGGIYNSLASAALANVAMQRNTALNSNPFVETFGGAIDDYQGVVRLQDASLISNTANSGGGIFVISGTLTVTNTQLISNTAEPDNGGGLEVAGSGHVKLTHAVFEHNHAGSGGGLSAETSGDAVELYATSFISNTADVEGGGLYSSGYIYNETALFSDNAATRGGGLSLYNAPLTATDLTLDDNYASEAGGGARFNGGLVTLYGLAATNNHTNSAGRGGGLSIENSNVTLYSPVVSGNYVPGTGQGGGVDMLNSFLSGSDLLLSDNQVGGGGSGSGGGLNALSSIFLIYGATLRGNAAGLGGALYFDTSQTLVVSGTVSGNTAEGQGGAVYLNGSIANLVSDTLSDNHSGPATSGPATNTMDAPNSSPGEGGAIMNIGGSLGVSNTTLSGNSSTLLGGGLTNIAGAVALVNVTLSGNASPNGGGLFNTTSHPTETLTVTNTLVVAGNQGGNCSASGAIVSGGYNLSSDNTCASFFNQTGDLNNVNPHLEPLTNNGGPTPTHLPEGGSPAIDAIPFGVNGCGTTLIIDQRGAPRPIHGKCDIGAVEAGARLPQLWLPIIRH